MLPDIEISLSSFSSLSQLLLWLLFERTCLGDRVQERAPRLCCAFFLNDRKHDHTVRHTVNNEDPIRGGSGSIDD